ncbi:MAG: AAA family ATPase [Polyangiaceae bacterium]
MAHDDREKTPLLNAAVLAPTQPQVPLVFQARVLRVTYENNDTGYRVLRVEVPGVGVETVVGMLPPVGPDVELHIVGHRVNDSKHGPQISVDHATVVTPTTRDGIIRFLGSGIVRGVGPKTAERIVAHLGDETLRELDEGGERLGEVKGIGPSMAKAIAEAWKVHRGTSDAMVFLRGHDIPSGLAGRIFRKYGPDTIRVVQSNPYRLAHEVNGVGFIKADRIAESLGVARDAPDRVDAGVVHSLFTINEEGHTFAMRWELAARASEQLGVPADLVETSIDRGVLAGHLVLEEEPGGIRVFPRSLYAAECDVALSLKRLLTTPSPVLSQAGEFLDAWESTSHLKLAAAQRTAVLTAAASKVMVLTGGPGVGKTTVVRAVLEMFRHAHLRVKLAAPTGRAAKRMAEATRFEASTIHRLLEVDPRSGKFQRDASNPIECDALIVDESSMIDIVLARALLVALAPGARLIMVGDADQLPSVGPGAVLQDLIASGALSVVKLETIFRQGAGSLIVDNAHRIRAGEMPSTSSSPDGDFFLIDQRDAESARAMLREIVQHRISVLFLVSTSSRCAGALADEQERHGGACVERRLAECAQPERARVDACGSCVPSGRQGDAASQRL